MAFTIQTSEKPVILNEQQLTTQLQEIARAAEAPKQPWGLAIGADSTNVVAEKTKATLNQLQPAVLETNNKKLIELFRRAVRNHDTLHPTLQADTVPTFNKHYEKPPFLVPKIHVTLDICEEYVEVESNLEIKRDSEDNTLVLDGMNHEVMYVKLNGQKLSADQYFATPNELIILNVPKESNFNVVVKSKINPFENDSLQGLYKCGKWLTTQCESIGARRIFFNLDRPDVLSQYTTSIIADPKKYPYRISNGNFVSEEKVDDTKVAITWEDPFPKPSYLFATVLGDFGRLEDTFKTRSGREVKLEVFMEKGKEERAKFSLWALKKSMEFDEKFYDREYDLDSLKMVAMPDFNSGAMENKGLLIFNEPCILVDQKCASDMDFYWVALVVCHEYCHNWSGNRVTVRNWFEIALKEAFTDFRTAKFMEWLYGKELVRPKDAATIRDKQFPQDASPGAHPIQVDSYVSTDEVYDHTTYVKGREVFRMLETIIDEKGKESFRVAQNAYFDRYDGQAVTFRELLSTLEEVSGVDLTQFQRWFHQPGTPVVTPKTEYDSDKKIMKIHLHQECCHPKTKVLQKPFHIPLYVELLGSDGQVLVPRHLVELKDNKATLVYEDIGSLPTAVFHHDFCAPIKVKLKQSNDRLALIMQHEQDPFLRSEAIEAFQLNFLGEMVKEMDKHREVKIPEEVVELYRHALTDDKLTPRSKCKLLQLPSVRQIVSGKEVYDYEAANKLRSGLMQKLAVELESEINGLLFMYAQPEEYNPESENFSEDMAIRELRNCCYSYLSCVEESKYNDMIFAAYKHADCFNDRMALLHVIANIHDPRTEKVLEDFYQEWKGDGTIFCNWISTIAYRKSCDVAMLQSVFEKEGFLKKNPNHIRALIRTFVNNLSTFHANPEENYAYVVDRILEFGKFNPSVASFYLASPAFIDYAKLPDKNKAIMKEQMKRLLADDVHATIRSVAKKFLEG